MDLASAVIAGLWFYLFGGLLFALVGAHAWMTAEQSFRDEVTRDIAGGKWGWILGHGLLWPIFAWVYLKPRSWL